LLLRYLEFMADKPAPKKNDQLLNHGPQSVGAT
jgi:hypothetical protein